MAKKQKQRTDDRRRIVTLAEARRSDKRRSTVAPSIQYDKPSGKFIVSFYHGMTNGKADREHRFFDSLAEAKEALARFKVEKYDGTAQKERRDLTLGQCIDEYIENAVQTGKIERTTERGYRVIARRIATQPVYDKQAAKIEGADIENYIANIRKDTELKNVTICKDFQLIRAAMMYAVRQKYIKHDITKDVEPPKREHYEETTLTLDEMNNLRDALLKSGDWLLTVAVFLGMYQGLRRGEMIGLKWEHISFDDNIFKIRETRTQMGGEIIDKAPKSENSIRDIYMNKRTRDALLAFREYQRKRGILGEYVLITNKGARVNPTHLSKKFAAFLAGNGLRHIPLHGLRHTFATRALDNHASPLDVSRALGHSDVSITLTIYTHTSPDASKKVNDVMEGIF